MSLFTTKQLRETHLGPVLGLLWPSSTCPLELDSSSSLSQSALVCSVIKKKRSNYQTKIPKLCQIRKFDVSETSKLDISFSYKFQPFLILFYQSYFFHICFYLHISYNFQLLLPIIFFHYMALIKVRKNPIQKHPYSLHKNDYMTVKKQAYLIHEDRTGIYGLFVDFVCLLGCQNWLHVHVWNVVQR